MVLVVVVVVLLLLLLLLQICNFWAGVGLYNSSISTSAGGGEIVVAGPPKLLPPVLGTDAVPVPNLNFFNGGSDG